VLAGSHGAAKAKAKKKKEKIQKSKGATAMQSGVEDGRTDARGGNRGNGLDTRIPLLFPSSSPHPKHFFKHPKRQKAFSLARVR